MPDPHGVMKKYPHTLSGGMRQRVMIAMALCCNPGLLIADEPTTALDVTIQAQIMALLRNLQKESGMSMILITHDIGLVASMADRVIVMYAGQMIEEAPVKELFKLPAHPYTKRTFCRRFPEFMTKRDRELVAIPGMVPENYDSDPRLSGLQTAAPSGQRLRSASELQTDRGRTFCQMYARQRRRNVKMSINMEEKTRRREPLIRVENLKKILSHPGGVITHTTGYVHSVDGVSLFDCRGRNPRSGGRIRLRQIDGGQTAGRPGKADGRQAVLSWKGYGEAFRKREKERAHAAADGVPGPIFFP